MEISSIFGRSWGIYLCPFSLLPRKHIINRVIFVNPCELNVIITILTNYFYTTLSREDFVCLSVFLNELSKSMFTTTLFQGLCDKGNRPPY